MFLKEYVTTPNFYKFVAMKSKSDINKLTLAKSAILKFLSGLLAMATLLFIPAGSISYVGGWTLMALLFIPMLLLGVVMLCYSPELLQQRLNAKEKREQQKWVTALSSLIFILGFIVAGLDYRFSLTEIPNWLRVASSVLFIISYVLYAEVVRENQWLSRTIKVSENQQVVSRGLYGVVRHPMYTSTITLFISMPIVLGSWWSLLIFLFYIPIIVVRIIDEEKLLLQELKGYDQYCKNVRWRLFPYLW